MMFIVLQTVHKFVAQYYKMNTKKDCDMLLLCK